MNVEVALARPEHQIVVQLQLASGATVADALERAEAQLPDVDLDAVAVGIFGQVCDRETKLKPWDRVEIYRPLKMDAKEARRQRAKKHSA